jgi:hypothetical protein
MYISRRALGARPIQPPPAQATLYTQSESTSLLTLSAPQPPILGEFKSAAVVLLPQNSDFACKKGSRGRFASGWARFDHLCVHRSLPKNGNQSQTTGQFYGNLRSLTEVSAPAGTQAPRRAP